MQLPPPEKRKCEECLNTIPLNHFKLNSTKCRYCQEGLPVPPMLIDKKTTPETTVNKTSNSKASQTEVSSVEQYPLVENNDTNQPIISEIE